MSEIVTAEQIQRGYRPAIGQLVHGQQPGLCVKVIRWNSDGWDPRRCVTCGQQFGYGPIGERVTDKALTCFVIDCTPDGAR